MAQNRLSGQVFSSIFKFVKNYKNCELRHLINNKHISPKILYNYYLIGMRSATLPNSTHNI